MNWLQGYVLTAKCVRGEMLDSQSIDFIVPSLYSVELLKNPSEYICIIFIFNIPLYGASTPKRNRIHRGSAISVTNTLRYRDAAHFQRLASEVGLAASSPRNYIYFIDTFLACQMTNWMSPVQLQSSNWRRSTRQPIYSMLCSTPQAYKTSTCRGCTI